jgi:hypothetical protein
MICYGSLTPPLVSIRFSSALALLSGSLTLRQPQPPLFSRTSALHACISEVHSSRTCVGSGLLVAKAKEILG